jgi:hypothetical protein
VLFSSTSTKFVAICNKPRIPRDINFCLTFRRAFSPLFKVFSVNLEGIVVGKEEEELKRLVMNSL